MSLVNSFYTRNAYTIEELYSYLSNYTFCAGAPQLITSAFGENIIVFHVDDYNSIWITPDQSGVRTQNWVISKQDQDPGAGNFIKHAFVDDLTFGLAGTASLFGKNAEDSFKYVDELVQQINSLGL